jgi:hypothetical protein
MSLVPAVLLALLFGAGLAWWSYRSRLTEPLARFAAIGRLVGAAALLLLVINPTIAARFLIVRPLVLLDNSISMHAAGGRAGEAREMARTLGDTTTFGEIAPGEPGGQSALAAALPAALATGRPVTVITDGEIADAVALPPDLLAATTIRLLSRPEGDDIALLEMRGTTRLTLGDSLHLEVEVQRLGAAVDSVVVELRDGPRALQRSVIRLGATGRGRGRLVAVLPAASTGLRWLEVHRVGAADQEPGNDVRWWPVQVTPTPGIVVLAATPDWDARALYRGLRDLTEAPVRGYVQLQPGQWRRMDDLRRMTVAEVNAAARAADLLAVRGDIAGWRNAGRARLLWPVAPMPGDWYLAPSAASPVSDALAGVANDSIPPAVAITALDAEATRGWVGATARLARRGSAVPVLGGREDGSGRTVTVGADGLYRWAFRGGASEQHWRAMLADASAWLLATADSVSASIQPVTLVTQRGRPVRFRWTGRAAPVTTGITLRDSVGSRTDSLRFDGAGTAAIILPVGRYQYALSGGGDGVVAVEPYSDELVRSPRTLVEQDATVAPMQTGRGAQAWWPLFAIAMVSFGAEWLLRRRLGMR